MTRESGPPPFDRRVAALAAIAFFMEILDGTIIQTATPSIAHGFGTTPQNVTVAITGYFAAVAVGTPLSVWVAERVGIRRTFIVASCVFTVASLLCAFAGSLVPLLLARILQGAGGAFMVPVGRQSVLQTTKSAGLVRAIAYLTWPGLLAPVAAPVLGGALTDAFGWPWIFIVNVPIGIGMIIAAAIVLPRSQLRPRRSLDWIGFALVSGALTLVTLGAQSLSSPGVPTALSIAAVAVGLGAAVAAWLYLRASSRPLFTLRTLAIPTFRVGNISGSVYRLTITSVPLLLTLLFQIGFGWSATQAGLVLIALFAGNIAIKPATSPLLRKLGFRTVLIWSNLLGLATLIAISIAASSTSIVVTAALLFLGGVFRSVGFTAYGTIQFADVPDAVKGDANALSSTFQQAATTLGVAAAALFVSVGFELSRAMAGSAEAAYRIAFLPTAALLLIPLVGAIVLPKRAGDVVVRRGTVEA